MKDKEKQIIKFSVIDNKTGEYPDLYNIALKEDWAKELMYCDMEGFSINEDGQLILSDECGKFVYCPSDRFSIKFEDSVVLTREEVFEVEDKISNLTNKVKLYQQLLDEMGDKLKQVSKETAEKILRDIKKEHWYIGSLEKKIAKQFNVEIKE